MTLTSRFHFIFLFVALVVASIPARAELGQDTHVQETGEVRIEVDRQVFQEFARMFNLGYPPATVMMHAVSTGMSINDILYVAVKSDIDRAGEFYDTAESLLPALPGWVCQADVERGRYTRELDLSQMGERPSIRRIAELYFDANQRVVPFPNWIAGSVHMEASVEELAELVDNQSWYVPGEDDGTPRTAPNRPVFVSLYPQDRQIVVDSGAERIRRAQEQGLDRLPVVLVYNGAQQRPISSFDPDVSVANLAEEFFGEGIELTAVPEWQVGDYHKLVTPDELRELVDVPQREDVLESRWDSVEQEIRANGMQLPRPLLLTLIRSGQGRAWVDDPTTVAVASELGVEEMPVVLFYHRLDRTPCGQPSSCQDLLCEAATAAGASEEVCGTDEGQSTAAAGSGAAGERSGTEHPVALGVDPRLYDGLSYTQNQCTS